MTASPPDVNEPVGIPRVTTVASPSGSLRPMLPDAVALLVVSGVPLLNFPVAKRVHYIESLLDRIPHGRPIVQLTYGPKSPVPPGLGDYTVERFDFIIRNIPPTILWIYRRGKRH